MLFRSRPLYHAACLERTISCHQRLSRPYHLAGCFEPSTRTGRRVLYLTIHSPKTKKNRHFFQECRFLFDEKQKKNLMYLYDCPKSWDANAILTEKTGIVWGSMGTKLLNLYNNLLKIEVLLCSPTNFSKPLDNLLES